MRRVLLPVLLSAGLALAACGSKSPTGDATPAAGATRLEGMVGTPSDPDAFVISLTNQDGTPVTTLPAGPYAIKVVDNSEIHNFALKGQGIDKETSVTGKATTTFNVTLKKGTYMYICVPHQQSMHGSVTVT